MHNCKTTGSKLIDLALEESTSPTATAVASDNKASLLAELAVCGACRAEYASLRRTLGIVDRAAQAAAPAESFWPGYHSRLSERLKNVPATGSPALPLSSRTWPPVWATLREIAGASIRIPVPVAAVLFLIFGLSIFLGVKTRGQAKPASLPPVVAVNTKTIEAPVITERVVTRVVYVPTNRRLSPARPERPERDGTRNFALAAARQEPLNKTALNLSGFRPTDQVKLTIIKGSYHDEK